MRYISVSREIWATSCGMLPHFCEAQICANLATEIEIRMLLPLHQQIGTLRPTSVRSSNDPLIRGYISTPDLRHSSTGLHLQLCSEALTNSEIYGDMQRQRPEELSFAGSESTETSDSTSRRGSATTRRDDTRATTGRREVVAMACQPCRKRKTKVGCFCNLHFRQQHLLTWTTV